MFEKGNQHGRHNNHYGRLTKEQTAALKDIVSNSIECWKKILNREGVDDDRKWQSLKADVASKVINKFVPELVSETKEVDISDRLIEFAGDLATRISGFSKGIERRPEITHDQTSVQAEH